MKLYCMSKLDDKVQFFIITILTSLKILMKFVEDMLSKSGQIYTQYSIGKVGAQRNRGYNGKPPIIIQISNEFACFYFCQL